MDAGLQSGWATARCSQISSPGSEGGVTATMMWCLPFMHVIRAQVDAD
jgi:hypothetical protein